MPRQFLTPAVLTLTFTLSLAIAGCHGGGLGGGGTGGGGGSGAGSGGGEAGGTDKGGGGGGDTGGLSIRGRVSSDLALSGAPLRSGHRMFIEPDGTEVFVDRVCGMPVGRKTLSVTGELVARETYCAAVGTDGAFSVPLGNPADDWVYVLVDSRQAKKARVVGFVGLPDVVAAGASLLSWPAAEQTKDVDLGTLSPQADGGEVAASKTMGDNQQAFTLSLGQLETLAKNSQLMKALRNDFVNVDTSTGRYYSVSTSHIWSLGLADAVGQWSPLPSSAAYTGYGITVTHDDPDLDATHFCHGGGDIVVVPPAPLTVTDKWGEQHTFDTAHPFTNADAGEIDPRQWCDASGGQLSAGGTGAPPWILGLPQQLTAPVSGTWVLEKNGVETAWFDVAVTLPFAHDDPTGPIIAPVPRVKLTVDADDTLTRVDVTWWYYDAATGAYVEAEDPAMIQRLIGGRYNILLTNFEAPAEEKRFSNDDADTPMMTSFTSFDTTWNLGAHPPAGATRLERLGLDFAVGRSVLSFSFQ